MISCATTSAASPSVRQVPAKRVPWTWTGLRRSSSRRRASVSADPALVLPGTAAAGRFQRSERPSGRRGRPSSSNSPGAPGAAGVATTAVVAGGSACASEGAGKAGVLPPGTDAWDGGKMAGGGTTGSAGRVTKPTRMRCGWAPASTWTRESPPARCQANASINTAPAAAAARGSSSSRHGSLRRLVKLERCDALPEPEVTLADDASSRTDGATPRPVQPHRRRHRRHLRSGGARTPPDPATRRSGRPRRTG